MEKTLLKTVLFVLATLLPLAQALPAGERVAPPPCTLPIPVVDGEEAADRALAAARNTPQALVADLTRGHEGALLAAAPAAPLAPGRYRLHALVATTPHDHILTQAVALRLAAGKTAQAFARHTAFPAPGQPAPVTLDFVVEPGAPAVLRAGWFVDDTELDMQRFRSRGEARHTYLAQRQSAINQFVLQQEDTGTERLDDRLAAEDLELEAEPAAGPPARQPIPTTGAALPAYRLLLTGLVIERLTPVAIAELATDKPAYATGESIQPRVMLENCAAAPATVELAWTLADDETPQTPLATGRETVKLAAHESKSHTPTSPLASEGVEIVGRLSLSVATAGRRAARASQPFVMLPPARQPGTRDKRIFAHYMACWPIGYGALPYERRTEGKHLKHKSKDPKIARGGHVRNYALGPPDLELTPEESADLEIRRALRIGIDGFAIDAWAGGDGAKKCFDALIRTAAAKDYPFAVTICIDPACGGRLDGTVKWLLDNYSDNPKLARRGGKPLIFGYFSQGPAWRFAQAKAGAVTDAEKIALRSSALGWHLAGATFRAAERRVGTPVFYQFGYGYLFHPYLKEIPDETYLAPALGTIAHYVDAVGTFGFPGRQVNKVAAAVKASGAEWSGGIGMYHKENIPYELFIPPGTEWLEGKWRGIREQDASLCQLITWNDYGENSNVAPAWETRYTLYDLTGYHIEWWKTGKQPEVKRDRVYLIYAKYPRRAKVWPFAQGQTRPRKLEVLTILPQPGTIRLPGRDIEYEAPAGYARKQFPLSVGPVIAELLRGGKTVTRLEAPEPITDRPFRESNGFICYSTEFMRHWREDFGEATPFLYGEYADADNDGLPNWFEMYWFTAERGFKPVANTASMDLDAKEHAVTRWLDTSTMTLVEPDADPDEDGKTNLEEYEARTDPTVPAAKL